MKNCLKDCTEHCSTSTDTIIIGFITFNMTMQKQKNTFNSVKFIPKINAEKSTHSCGVKTPYSSDGKNSSRKYSAGPSHIPHLTALVWNHIFCFNSLLPSHHSYLFISYLSSPYFLPVLFERIFHPFPFSFPFPFPFLFPFFSPFLSFSLFFHFPFLFPFPSPFLSPKGRKKAVLSSSSQVATTEITPVPSISLKEWA